MQVRGISDMPDDDYTTMVAKLGSLLGSKTAAARALGVARSSIRYRLEHPDIVRREHVYAVMYLIQRYERIIRYG